MENAVSFLVKPAKEGKFYRMLEGVFFAFYHDGVLCESRICKAIGVRLGLLLNFVEEFSEFRRSLKRSNKAAKRALQNLTKEEWEEAREKEREELEG